MSKDRASRRDVLKAAGSAAAFSVTLIATGKITAPSLANQTSSSQAAAPFRLTL